MDVAAPTAGDVMSSPAITVTADATRRHIADVLTGSGISAAPVVDEDGRLLGLVSEFDLLAKPGEHARDVMTTAVVTVSAASPVEDVRHLLVERQIRRVPVVQEGRLVGIVSRRDVVALLATEWVCPACGEAVRGEHRPQACPKCHADGERFTLQEQPPGA